MKGPKHIGIIMDGNRRFAKKLMMEPWKGHEWGAKKLHNILEWCINNNVEELTLYALSLENFHSRPRNEFDYLMKLFKTNLQQMLDENKINEEGIKINFIGRIKLFEETLQTLMEQLKDKTKNNTKLTVNIAMAYGGKAEVVDAVKKISKQIKEKKLNIEDIDEDTVSNNLYLAHEPDLIIRTGGQKRTSNFLPYQSTYSEWIFLEKLFPEFEEKDFLECLNKFENRNRNFGN